MIQLKIWDKATPLIYPNGTRSEASQVFKDYPITQYATTVLGVTAEVPDGIMAGSIDSLEMLRNIHNIDPSLSDDQAVQAIQDIQNTPPPVPASTPEDRIAAALEFQNLMAAEAPGAAGLTFHSVESNFNMDLWNEPTVHLCCERDIITPEEYTEITGQEYEGAQLWHGV